MLLPLLLYTVMVAKTNLLGKSPHYKLHYKPHNMIQQVHLLSLPTTSSVTFQDVMKEHESSMLILYSNNSFKYCVRKCMHVRFIYFFSIFLMKISPLKFFFFLHTSPSSGFSFSSYFSLKGRFFIHVLLPWFLLIFHTFQQSPVHSSSP